MKSVFAIVDDLVSGLEELKAALKPLSALAAAPQDARSPRRPRATRKAARRTTTSKKVRKAPSPKIRALRTMQGKYLGALRNLTAFQRIQVKKAKAEKGYEPALKLAASLQK